MTKIGASTDQNCDVKPELQGQKFRLSPKFFRCISKLSILGQSLVRIVVASIAQRHDTFHNV